jgi:hypothetical protein
VSDDDDDDDDDDEAPAGQDDGGKCLICGEHVGAGNVAAHVLAEHR